MPALPFSFAPLTRRSSSRTVVWVSIAFALLALSAPALADGHKARLSRGLADAVAGGASRGVIVSGSEAQVRDLAQRHGLRVQKVLGGGAVLRVSTSGELAALSADPGVAVVADDAPVTAHMATEVEALGADQAWQGVLGLPGVNGKGIGIAVIDSGMATYHEALRNRVVVSVDFSGGVALPLRGDGARKGLDPYGHGTHVAGIVAGDVTTSQGRFAGVAPGAHLINLKVLDANGRGTTSNVIAAIEWAVANRKAYGIRVINLSVGKPVLESWVDDPLVQAVEKGQLMEQIY